VAGFGFADDRPANPVVRIHAFLFDVGRFIEFFGQGKNWRGFCNFVPEFLIDAWAGMAKLPVRF
jgi:hypothetical protein